MRLLLTFFVTIASFGCGSHIEVNTVAPSAVDEAAIGVDSNPERESPGNVISCFGHISDYDQLICRSVFPEMLKEHEIKLEITVAKVDLNSDGKDEVVAWESSWAGTGGGSLWVLSETKDGFKKLFETDMTWTPITLLSSGKKGWKDISYLMTGGGVKSTFITISFDGKSYKVRPDSSGEQPEGVILIGKRWEQSVFGPNGQ